MAQNINISLPEELFKRLQKVKEHLNNVSGICQTALETEIGFCELKMKGTKMSTVEKLRTQKKTYDKTYFVKGKTDGIKDAENMDYADLLEVIKSGNAFYKTEYYQNCMEDELKELFKEDPAFNEGKYIEGWLEGVTEFYEEIKDELE